MTPKLSTAIHRSLFALPLLAVALAAMAHEPPVARVDMVPLAAATADCSSAPRPAGHLGLARVPGDLGLISRRVHCAS